MTTREYFALQDCMHDYFNRSAREAVSAYTADRLLTSDTIQVQNDRLFTNASFAHEAREVMTQAPLP